MRKSAAANLERCSAPVEKNHWLVLADQWHGSGPSNCASTTIPMLLETGDASRFIVGQVPGKEWSLDELMPDEDKRHKRGRRMAMALLDLTEERVAQYPLIRRNFKAALRECGIGGTVADAWLDSNRNSESSEIRLRIAVVQWVVGLRLMTWRAMRWAERTLIVRREPVGGRLDCPSQRPSSWTR